MYDLIGFIAFCILTLNYLVFYFKTASKRNKTKRRGKDKMEKA